MYINCNSDGLCLQDITNEHYPTDEDPIVVGVKGKPYTISLTKREKGDLWNYPPHFIYKYADDSGDDYKDTEGPCTCAMEHRWEGENPSTEVHAQVCTCWFTCDQ